MKLVPRFLVELEHSNNINRVSKWILNSVLIWDYIFLLKTPITMWNLVNEMLMFIFCTNLFAPLQHYDHFMKAIELLKPFLKFYVYSISHYEREN